MNKPPATPASKPDSKFPLAQRLAEDAAREEVTTLIQYFVFHGHLAVLLRAALAEGLDLIVLKGAALAETLYARPGLRPFGDLDILARPADAVRAHNILCRLGYVVDADRWEELAQSQSCQANFFQPSAQGPIVVELHTDLINNELFWGQIRVDTPGLWQRAPVRTVAGVDAHVLGPEDQLLHLCLHLAGHYLAAPRSLRDVDQLCRVLPVDWPLFLRLAREAGAATACFCGLHAAAALLGAPVPGEVMDELAPRLGRRLLERCAVARAGDVAQARTENLRPLLLWFLLRTPQARFRALGRILFPSRRWLVQHYYHDRFHEEDAGHWRVLAVLFLAHAVYLLGRLARIFHKQWGGRHDR